MTKEKNVYKAVKFIYAYMEHLRDKKEYEWADGFRELLRMAGFDVKNTKHA